MKHSITGLSAIVAAILASAAVPSHAQTGPVTKTNPDVRTLTGPYWTPERFKAAKPLPLPMPAAATVREGQTLRPAGKSQSSEGRPPVEKFDSPGQQLFAPDPAPSSVGSELQVAPSAVGTFGAPYTSTRVFPMFTGSAAAYSADRAYPYVTVGKLFFTIDGVAYVCSASVIQARVVATAGHCVHSGTVAGFYEQLGVRSGAARQQCPAQGMELDQRRGHRHLGRRRRRRAERRRLRHDLVRRPADAPRRPSRASWATSPAGSDGSTLGLDREPHIETRLPVQPRRLPEDAKRHQQQLPDVAPNNVEYGSDARGGSSGGPWVQNFSTRCGRRRHRLDTGLNRVVGVTSYGYVSEDPKVQGASILDDRWVDLFNYMCDIPGNCR